MSWLGLGNQLAPIVVAATGVLSFAWTAATTRPQTGSASRLAHAVTKMWRRPHSRIAAGTGCLALLLTAVRIVVTPSNGIDLGLSLAAISCGIATFSFVIAGHVVAERNS